VKNWEVTVLRSGLFYRLAMLGGVLLGASAPSSAWACAACYGQSDSPLAAGMNWGILSLLVMIVSVLGGVGAFFVYLAKRSAAVSHPPTAEPMTETMNPQLEEA